MSYTGSMSAKGGSRYGTRTDTYAGSAGTIYLKDNAAAYGDLTFDNAGVTGVIRHTDVTLLGTLGPRTFRTLTVRNLGSLIIDAATSPFTVEQPVMVTGTGALTVATGGTLAVTNATGFDVNVESASTLTLQAGSILNVNAVRVSGGTLVKDGSFGATDEIGDLTIQSGGIVTHSVRLVEGLVLNVTGTLDVQVGGLIDVSAKGLCGGRNGSLFGTNGVNGETFNESDVIVSGATGASYGVGASYGGTGSPGQPGYTGVTNAPYGLLEEARHLGSGGSAGGVAGGNGGGRVTITAATVVVDGQVLANGGNGVSGNGSGGGGSGGSIRINAGVLSGSGSMQARGGNGVKNVYGVSGGGGGGRIALYNDTSTFPEDNITALGGITAETADPAYYGSAGTIYLKDMTDMTPPEIEFTIGPVEGAHLTTTSVEFCWIATDNFTPQENIEYAYQLDGGGLSPWGSLTCAILTGLSEQIHVLEVRARDNEENVAILQRTFTVDLTLPQTEITSGPADGGYSNSAEVTIGWTGSDNVTPVEDMLYSFRLDNEPWSELSSDISHLYNGLTDTVTSGPSGSALDFDGVDDQVVTPKWIEGIRDFWTMEIWFRRDGTSTGPCFVMGHRAENNDKIMLLDSDGSIRMSEQYATGSLNYSTPALGMNEWHHLAMVSTDTDLKYYLDGEILGSGVKVYGSSDWDSGYYGSYFGRSAYDPSGAGTIPGSVDEARVWNIARTAGQIREYMVRQVDPSTAGLVGYWKFDENTGQTAGDSSPSGFGGELGSSGDSDSNDPVWTDSEVWDGRIPHLFSVKAKDLAGFVDSSPDTVRFYVDLIAPETEITFGPSHGEMIDTADVLIGWTGTDDQTGSGELSFAWRMNGGSYSAFSPDTFHTFTGLPDGIHEVEIKARDLAMNEDLTPAMRSFTVGTQPPVPVITSGPGEGEHTSQVDITFKWTATDAVSDTDSLYYSAKIDSFDFSAWSRDTTITYEDRGEGPHSFSLRARDEQYQIGIFERNFIIDLTPPGTRLTGGPEDGACWPSASATLTWTGEDNYSQPAELTYAYKLDGGDFSGWSSVAGHSFTGLDQGSHTIAVKSRDRAGNEDPEPAEVTFDVGYTDLIPVAIDIPDSAHCARVMVVGWTVSNGGTCQLDGAWKDYIYLSTDNVAGSDQLLGSFDRTGPLPGEGSYEVSYDIMLPDNITGNYCLVMTTDGQQQVPEENHEDNNTLVSDVFVINIPPHPDLQVTEIVLPERALSGQGSYVEWTISNLGEGPASGGWTEYVYLSDDSLAGGDTKLSEFNYSYTLEAGMTYSHVHPVVFPADIEGDYRIVVTADAKNNVNEYGMESNNTAVSIGSFRIDLTPYPNLVVSEVTGPSTANSNSDIDLNWIVHNAGGVATSTPVWYDKVYLSSDQSPSGYYLGEFQNLSYLTAGGQYARQNISVHVPKQVPEGSYYLVVKTDARDNVEEHLDEGDNSMAGAPLAVTYIPYPRPDLAITNLVSPSMGWAGNTIPVSWTVENIGDAPASGSGQPVNWVILSTDSIADPHDRIHIGGDIIGSPLEPDGSFTKTVNVPLPVNYSGRYYLFVWTDVDIYFDDPELSNNFSEIRPLYINLPPPADLVVEAVTASVDTVIRGTSLPIQWDVVNNGAGPGFISGWTDAVYLSADQVLSTSSDTRVKLSYHEGFLEPDAGYRQDMSITVPSGLLGEYYIFAYADIYNQVGEGAYEGNNWAMRPNPVRVINPPSADLRVNDIAVTGEAWSGKTLPVSWLVQNYGPNATTGSVWNDYIYLSQDSVFNTIGATLLSSVSHSGLLQLNESYSNNRTVTLPQGISGSYYLHLQTDATNVIYEAQNEGNNTRCVAVLVELTPPPDLQVAELISSPAVMAGGKITAQWSVRNSGPGMTGQTSWVDRFYISTDTTYSSNDGYLAGFTYNGALDPDKFYQQNRDVTIPESYEGNYYLILRTDALGQVYEYTFENNNTAWNSLAVTAIPPDTVPIIPPPDLAMTGLSFVDGYSDTLSFTVRNISDHHPPTAQNYWTDRFYLSADSILSIADDIQMASFSHTGGLAPGASYVLTREIVLPNGTSGDYYIIGSTDATGRVTETDESNNLRKVQAHIDLTVPDLIVSGLTGADTVYAGQSSGVSWSVFNTGNGPSYPSNWYDGIYLSKDQILDATDYNLSSCLHQNGLEIGAGYNGSATVNIPNGLTGRHYFFIKTDKNNSVYEHDKEDNNIFYAHEGVEILVLPPDYDLQVSSVTMPDTGTVGEEIRISWVVTNLGDNDLYGQWMDAVYFSSDTDWDSGDTYLGSAVRSTGLGAHSEYRQALMLPAEDFYGLLETLVPGLEPGDYHIIVVADIFNQISEIDETNNSSYSDSDLSLDLKPLFLGVPHDTIIAANAMQHFRLDIPSGQDLKFTIDIGHEFDELELYVGFGRLPNRIDYDRRFKIDGHEEFIVSSPDTNVCYIMMFGDYIIGGGNYSILPESIDFGLSDAFPPEVGNDGFVRFDLTGGQLEQVTTVRMRHSGGVTIDAWEYEVLGSTQIEAEFDLRGAQKGLYDILVYTSALDSSIIAEAVTVSEGLDPAVTPAIFGPESIREGTSIDYLISLHNNNNTDAHDIIHSIVFDGGTIYQLILDGVVAPIKISDGDPIYLFTDHIGVARSESYTVRLWGKETTSFETVTVSIDPEFVMAREKNLVIASWVNAAVASYASEVARLGEPVDEDELWANVSSKWDKQLSLVPLQSETVSLDRKLRMAITNLVPSSSPVPTPGLYDGVVMSDDPRAMLSLASVEESGILAAVNEGVNHYVAAVASGDYKKKKTNVIIRIARDPNEKFGPTDPNGENFVDQWQDIPYTIYFENISTASATAQNVLISDQLDPDLDWRKFRLGEIAFGDVVITVPENHSYYHTFLALDSGNLLEVDAGINGSTGLVHWMFSTIDPATGLPPIDPNSGFLPPNDTTHAGEGHVQFSIRADQEGLDGTEITNKALIVFDYNDPIETKTVVNVLQKVYPDLQVVSAASSVESSEFYEGREITLSATVGNPGEAPAANFDVAFYYGNPLDNGNLIGMAQMVDDLEINEEKVVYVTWIPDRVLGAQDIYIAVDPWGTTDEVIEDNNVRILRIDVEPRTFTADLGAGINFVALPLEPAIPYSARSFSALHNASMIIRYDTSGVFEPFLPFEHPGDGFVINNTEGYIVVTDQAGEVEYSGISHGHYVNYDAGMNFVSLPLDPPLSMFAGNFCNKLDAGIIIRYDNDDNRFEPYIPGFHEGTGFEIFGARGYLITMNHDKTVYFDGEGWQGAQPIPAYTPAQIIGNQGEIAKKTGVMGFTGRITLKSQGDEGPVTGEYSLFIKNKRNDCSIPIMTDPETGLYSGAFVDYSNKEFIINGDRLIYTLIDKKCNVAFEPFEYEVHVDDISRRYIVSEITFESPIPLVSKLYQNYPNPFNPATRIKYQVASRGKVNIKVYNVAGQLVKTIVDEVMNPGYYELIWDGTNNRGSSIASGVYFCRMEAPDYVKSMKMVILR